MGDYDGLESFEASMARQRELVAAPIAQTTLNPKAAAALSAISAAVGPFDAPDAERPFSFAAPQDAMSTGLLGLPPRPGSAGRLPPLPSLPPPGAGFGASSVGAGGPRAMLLTSQLVTNDAPAIATGELQGILLALAHEVRENRPCSAGCKLACRSQHGAPCGGRWARSARRCQTRRRSLRAWPT